MTTHTLHFGEFDELPTCPLCKGHLRGDADCLLCDECNVAFERCEDCGKYGNEHDMLHHDNMVQCKRCDSICTVCYTHVAVVSDGCDKTCFNCLKGSDD